MNCPGPCGWRGLAPVLAIITTADPVISIGLGVLWLGVRLRGSPAEIFGQVASLLLMIAGIVSTAHHAPQVALRDRGAGHGAWRPVIRGHRGCTWLVSLVYPSLSRPKPSSMVSSIE